MSLRHLPATAAVLAALLLPACGTAGTEVVDAGPAPARDEEPPAEPTVPSTTEVTVYYVAPEGNRLVLARERHTVPKAPRIATAALEEVVHGTSEAGLPNPFPPGARVLSVTIAVGTATVDFNAAVLDAAMGGEAEAAAIQSAVWTLTEFPTITQVRFTVEGRDRGPASNGRAIEDWWGHVGLAGQPFTRDTSFPVRGS
jgi:spore germination protein GerM